MAQIFPRWANALRLIGPTLLLIAATALIAAIWYFGSPLNTDVGYRPEQPVAYSHRLHAGDLAIDCRYCHTTVETAATASIPSTQICMNCHKLVGPENDKLNAVRASWESGRPILWTRVHNLPDYAYFDHSLHLHAGVGCSSCHGRIDQMELVTQREPLSMGWCLDCHRNPGPYIRPRSEVTNMAWQSSDPTISATSVSAIHPPEDCTACHR